MIGRLNLIALVLGLAVGLLIAHYGTPQLVDLVKAMKLVGDLWLNLLKMTLVPLIFSLVAASTVAALSQMDQGDLVRRTLVAMAALLVLAAAWGGLSGQLLLMSGLIPSGLLAMPAAAVAHAAPVVGDLVKGLVPSNIVAAASDGALASVSIFALLFGLFVARTQGTRPDRVLPNLLDHMAQAMLAMAEWILKAAPLAVLCFSLNLAMTMGAHVASFILIDLTCIIVVLTGVIALAYGVAVVFGGQPLARFAIASLPAQEVGLGTQSSLAALPLMIEAATQRLNLPDVTSRLVLSLSAALFRYTSAASAIAGAMVMAHLYGQPVSLAQIALAIPTAILVSLASASIPGMATVYAGRSMMFSIFGLPLDLIPVLVAVETLPDIFKTVGNIVADLALAAVVGRGAVSSTEG